MNQTFHTLELVNMFQNRWARLLRGQTTDDFIDNMIEVDKGYEILPVLDLMLAVRENEESERDIYRHFRNAPINEYLENGGDLRDIPNPIEKTDIRDEELPF